MRINQFLAKNTSLSRRSADTAVSNGQVTLNNKIATNGDQVQNGDVIIFDNKKIIAKPQDQIIIMLNKPVGYVCSRNGQGSPTIYDLLPSEYKNLQSIGRLDKESSGLILLTNDGDLANELTHPKYAKLKIYEVGINRPIQPLHQQMINDIGIQLDDGPSKLTLEKLDNTGKTLKVSMKEGRNRQIRRTFGALGYDITKLHRTNFGNYSLGNLKPGKTQIAG